MDERRLNMRQRTLKAGKIEFNRRLSVIDCVIRNMSERGACLQVDGVDWLPEKFDLLIPIDGTRRRCRMIWKTLNRLGVAFEAADEQGRAA